MENFGSIMILMPDDISFYRSILSLSDLAWWSIDMEKGILHASDRFWEMLGYLPDELEPTLDNLKKIHYPEDWDIGWDLIADHIRGETPFYRNELRYLTKDSRWLWCEVRGIVSERDGEGNPLTFIGYCRDISAVMELKRELERISSSEDELKNARKQIDELAGIIPICSSCKSIRNDEGYWKELEAYIETHSNAVFSHGLCEKCTEKLYKDKGWFQKYRKRLGEEK